MMRFRDYLRQRRRLLCLLTLFCGIFAVTFALYELPLGAVWYPAVLCAAAGAAAAWLDWRRVCRRHDQLCRVHSMAEAVGDGLPEPERVEDADYQEIIRILCQEQAVLRTDMGRRYEDMVDYYTTWAHQIKTPIASMRLTLQNEDSPLSRRLTADLFRVEQYVEMVLVFLRLDADSTDYVIRQHDLDAIIRQSVKKFAGEFIDRRLRLDYEPVQVRVVTDEKWLGFVIEQVLSNALKYTPTGSISVTLEEPQTLCIRDTGMGIAPEDLPRVFEKGYTGCHGRTDRRSSGIGLYLCRRICRNLGHSISIRSKPDEGTAVYIDLRQRELEVE